MAVTVSTTPTYPLPGAVRVRFAADGAGVNYVRAWVSSAPAGSKLRKLLDDARGKSGAARVQVFEGGPANEWRFDFDLPGAYVVKVAEYVFAGRDVGIDSSATETMIGSESTLTIYIGHRLRSRFGAAGRGTVDLAYYVWNDTIRATTLIEHGAVTPAWESPSSLLVSATATNLEGSVSSVVGTPLTTVVGTLTTLANTFRTKFDAHRTQGGVHASNDTVNALGAEWAMPTSGTVGAAAAFVQVVNKLRDAFLRHVTNDSGAGPGTGAVHAPSSVETIDWANVPIAPSAGTPETAVVLLADLVRCYEAHRASTTPHNSADATNTIGAVSAWITLHANLLGALAQMMPASTPSTHQAAVYFAVSSGFARTE